VPLFGEWGLAALAAPPAAAAAPELSVADRLQDRRALVSGERAYSVGFQDGRFYANGWHITGEMGGVWTPPLKLLDGVWFGVDGQWVGPATRFRSGWGYTRMDFPDTAACACSAPTTRPTAAAPCCSASGSRTRAGAGAQPP
jgi:hypothetical protein